MEAKKMQPSFVNQTDQEGKKVPVGYCRHNGPQPISHKNDKFETASWYEDIEIPTGIYPIYVGWDSYGRHGGQPKLYIQFTGKVVDDFFPSSLGGYGTGTRTTPQHIGEERKVDKVISFQEAISQTGNSPQKEGQDIYINPKYYTDFAQYFEELVKQDIESLQWFRRKTPGGGAVGRNAKDTASSTKTASSWVNQSSKTLETIYEAIQSNEDSYLSKLKDKNTQWVKNFEIFSKILEDEFCVL
jgi:hypothetical protein